MSPKKTPRLFTFALVVILLVAGCSFPSSEQLPQGNEDTPIEDSSNNGGVPPETVNISVDLVGPQIGTIVVWSDNSELVFIPGGEFIMGGNGNDNPQHTITLSLSGYNAQR